MRRIGRIGLVAALLVGAAFGAGRISVRPGDDLVAFTSARGMIQMLYVMADSSGTRVAMHPRDDRLGWSTTKGAIVGIALVDSTGEVITSLGLDSTRLLAGEGITLDWNGDTVTIIGAAVDPEVLDSLLQANGIDSANVSANSHALQGKDTTALWNAKTLQTKDTTYFVKVTGTGSDSTGNHLVVQATRVRGAVIGNVTGNTSGSSGSCTGNAATASEIATDGTDAQVWGMSGSNQAWIDQTGEGGGISAAAASDSIQAHLPEIRDTVLTMTGADSIVYDGDDGIGISYADDTVRFKGDSAVLAFLDKVNVFTKAYGAEEVAETCAANSHVHVNLKASNFHFVKLGQSRDTIVLDSARAGFRYWLTLEMPAANLPDSVIWVPAPLWDSVANKLDFKASAVNVVTLGKSGVKNKFIGAINGPFE